MSPTPPAVTIKIMADTLHEGMTWVVEKLVVVSQHPHNIAQYKEDCGGSATSLPTQLWVHKPS